MFNYFLWLSIMKRYFFLIVLIFSIKFMPAVAQIVYTDINPDTILVTKNEMEPMFYDFDINKDGINDFAIAHHTIVQFFSGYNGSLVLVSELDDFLIPSKLSYGDIINAGKETWYDSQHCSINMDQMWPGNLNTYIGLKFMFNNQWHYGWLRIDIPEDGKSCVLKDYAYQSTPNEGILAGDNGISSVNDDFLKKNQINIENKVLSVKISNEQCSSIYCNIYDIYGNLQKLIKYSGYEFSYDLEDIPTGVIFVVVSYNDKIFTKKLLLIQ